jgi:hypothetical protein
VLILVSHGCIDVQKRQASSRKIQNSSSKIWELGALKTHLHTTSTLSNALQERITRPLMLLARQLPPQFLLPAWGSRCAYQALQRAHKSDSTKAPRAHSTRNPESDQSQEKKKRAKSLFEELFPEEAPKEARQQKESVPEKLQPFEWNVGLGFDNYKNPSFSDKPKEDGLGLLKAKLKNAPKFHPPRARQKNAKQRQAEEWRRRSAIVLKLGNASTSLEESDFTRVSHKGAHITNWTGGIIKGIILQFLSAGKVLTSSQ